MAHGSQIASMMQKAPDLSLTVKAECEQRGVPWETMARQDTGPAVEYSFPEDLKFTVEVSHF